jgi:hypothetical protein
LGDAKKPREPPEPRLVVAGRRETVMVECVEVELCFFVFESLTLATELPSRITRIPSQIGDTKKNYPLLFNLSCFVPGLRYAIA